MSIKIAVPSSMSLLIGTLWNGRTLGTATAFIVARQDSSYLITNRHVVTGRHQDTGAPLDGDGATPQFLQVLHNSSEGLGRWVERTERLYDENVEPRWLEHPTLGKSVDVVALPLVKLDGVATYPYDPWQSRPDIDITVARDLSIVGFPFGTTGGGALPIWSRAAIASEPQVDLNDLPRFLVDSRTRPGQSGSPVIFYSGSGMIPIRDKGLHAMGETMKFIGVYSGRINDQSDLGYVWKANALGEVIANGRRPSYTDVCGL